MAATTPGAEPDKLPYPENVEPGKPGAYFAKPDETCHKVDAPCFAHSVAVMPHSVAARACAAAILRSPRVSFCTRQLRLDASDIITD